MYLQETHISEQVSIAEQLIFKDQAISNESVLVPDNYGELLIPLNEDFDVKLIGNARFISLFKNEAYFLAPRGRGLEINSSSAKYLLIKINPIYTKCFCCDCTEYSNGVFKMNLNTIEVKNIKLNAKNNNKYKVSDLLGDLLKLDNIFEFNYTILDSIERIKQTAGTTSIKEIYSYLNVSKSKLEQHFNKELGLTPKEFCKIEKLNFFINSYKDNNKSLTELTYECGYYDQSHLIKDFNYFLNTSPKKYFHSLGL